MNDIKIEWTRCESWSGSEKWPEQSDDSWSARHGPWRLEVDPLRRRDCNGWRAGDEHVGWKWSVTPKDLTKRPSYSGTVPGVDALDEAKHESECALKRRLASEAAL